MFLSVPPAAWNLPHEYGVHCNNVNSAGAPRWSAASHTAACGALLNVALKPLVNERRIGWSKDSVQIDDQKNNYIVV